MVTKKRFDNIYQLQQLQNLAVQSPEDVGLHSEDGSVIIDAKSFIGLFALDFTKPVLVVCESVEFHKSIRDIGETVEVLPQSMEAELNP